MFSAELNHRSTTHTSTPNSRLRKMDEVARPQPRSRIRIPGCRSSADASHSVSHSTFAPLLQWPTTQSGWYAEERGNRSDNRRSSRIMALDGCVYFEATRVLW